MKGFVGIKQEMRELYNIYNKFTVMSDFVIDQLVLHNLSSCFFLFWLFTFKQKPVPIQLQINIH